MFGPEGGALGLSIANRIDVVANAYGTLGSVATTVADAKNHSLGSGTAQTWLYTLLGWVDPDAVTGSLVDADTVISDFEAFNSD
ncbi:MAG TPA: hypothetical protein DEV93_04295 [Chloroflexi bacterium]|jgi:hypothetical protein|nr:hypothetical protein [Chloroflexota bacterium]